MMETWVGSIPSEDDKIDDMTADDELSNVEYKVDPNAGWENAETVIETITDSENKRYEIIKKVRTYRVDRPITEADIRANWARFGKESGERSKDIVSSDPPIVLELGDIDPFERAARDEVVRLMNEVERARIEVTDQRLARFAKIKEEQEKAAVAEASPTESKERTWAAARKPKGPGVRKEDTERRLRISNITDDITKEELENIFNTEWYSTENVYLPEDRVTGNYKGFAFITFETAEQATRCLERTKGVARFKNTVMKIVRAIPEGDRKRY